jgi:hypothetical protein
MALYRIRTACPSSLVGDLVHELSFRAILFEHFFPFHRVRESAIVTSQQLPHYSIGAHVSPHAVQRLRRSLTVWEGLGFKIALAIHIHPRVSGLKNELASIIGTIRVGVAVSTGFGVSYGFDSGWNA